MNIAIIDDNLVNAKINAAYINKLEDINSVVFTNPIEGLAYCQEEEVDMILVDYRMPELNGLELVRIVRGNPEKSGVPIVMVTAFNENDVRWAALDAGANDFLSKPVDEMELMIRVRNMLSLRSYTLELKRLATIDALTSIYNRRYFLEQAEKEMARARRYTNPLSVLMLDVDKFKLVNDTYGHAGGDAVLTKLASICLDELREIDFMGRLGGEEFSVCLTETNIEGAALVAERLRRSVENTVIRTDTAEINITVSIGFTEIIDSDQNFSCALNRADQALYSAKETGRNKVISL